MTAADLIAAFRQPNATASIAELTACFAFRPGKPQHGYATDTNQGFRAEVVKALLPDFSLADHQLIRALFAEEMSCEVVTQQHESLYQLSFYLYELGQLADTFALYEAKFRAQNMDVGVLLDRELMTVRHEVPEVIRYVEGTFLEQPELQARYPTILAELQALLEHPDHDDLAVYRAYLRGYFYGHEGEDDTSASLRDSTPTTSQSGYEPKPKPKPWWKIW